MTINYYIQRPTVQSSAQWTGDNFAEITEVVGDRAVNNNDGTVTVTTPDLSGTFTLATGQWVISDAWQGYDADPLTALQSVPSAGPLAYTVS